MVRTDRDRAIRPSEEYDALSNIEKIKSLKNGYPVCVRLNRLQWFDDIKLLFDDGFDKRAPNYYGKIAGVEAKIYFSTKHTPRLYTRSEEDSKKALKKVGSILG